MPGNVENGDDPQQAVPATLGRPKRALGTVKAPDRVAALQRTTGFSGVQGVTRFDGKVGIEERTGFFGMAALMRLGDPA